MKIPLIVLSLGNFSAYQLNFANQISEKDFLFFIFLYCLNDFDVYDCILIINLYVCSSLMLEIG